MLVVLVAMADLRLGYEAVMWLGGVGVGLFGFTRGDLIFRGGGGYFGFLVVVVL